MARRPRVQRQRFAVHYTHDCRAPGWRRCVAAFPCAHQRCVENGAASIGLCAIYRCAQQGAPWAPELDYLLLQDIPGANETEWFHRPSATLIRTDVCQWGQGDLPMASVLFDKLTGVRQRLDVPRTVRMPVRDKAAVHASAARILQWPFTRVLVAHNSVVETDAHAEVARAFGSLAGLSLKATAV